ncbi:MAG: lytic transglycosylase domain-containing protein [Calditrichaeota bacterium]|nr:lytic transglycosylase domain-containing protein [Calditrichota bacterium]
MMKSFLYTILIVTVSLNFFAFDRLRNTDEPSRFENMVSYLRAVTEVDQARQAARRKVVNIIRRFNPDMPVSQSEEIADEIYEMSVKYPNLDLDLICATITHESGRTWDPQAISKAGAMGLMQIMPATGKWLARFESIDWLSAEDVLFDPVYNIRLGTRYLSALVETYDLYGGLAAYNGGGKRVRLWLANQKNDDLLWAETRDYVPFVLKLYEEFRSESL